MLCVTIPMIRIYWKCHHFDISRYSSSAFWKTTGFISSIKILIEGLTPEIKDSIEKHSIWFLHQNLERPKIPRIVFQIDWFRLPIWCISTATGLKHFIKVTITRHHLRKQNFFEFSVSLFFASISEQPQTRKVFFLLPYVDLENHVFL